MTGLASTTTNSTLVDFEQATGRTMAARATYAQGKTPVALRMAGDMDRLRAVEDALRDGSYRPPAPHDGGIATLAGVIIVQEPRINHNLLTDKVVPANFARFTIDLDGMLEIEAITNGTSDDALAILAGLDIGSLLAELPETGALEAADN